MRPFVVQRVTHEVQSQVQVDLCSFPKWLAYAGNDALCGAPLKVEFHIAIHAVNFLLVPSLAILAHTREALPVISSVADAMLAT